MIDAIATTTAAPQVSVVIPVYNAEKYIAETLEAVATQDFADFDVHVVDDCSTDGSAAIIQAFCMRDARFAYHRAAKNFGGPAGPRNAGVAASAGQFIAFCDADDVWVPHKLSVQLAIIERDRADIVSAITRDFVSGDPLPQFSAPTSPVAATRITHRQLLIKNWIALSSVMVRRSALDLAGPFNIAPSHVAVEDYDMWLRITGQGGRAVRAGVPLVHYRKLPTSISASKSMMVRKALNVIGEDYARRGVGHIFSIMRPLHWLAYIGSSAWMRTVRREL